MRAVLQRVRSASVSVDGDVIASIGAGIMALVAFADGDGESDMDYVAGRIASLRIFPDDAGRMNLSLAETGGSLLVVSQFTLYGDTRKGRRPSFSGAMVGDRAGAMFEEFVGKCRALVPVVERGVFGAHMEVALVNDGPVALIVDSAKTL